MSIMMADQPVDLKAVDCSVKNKFRWDWLQRRASLSDQTYSLAECIRKVNLPGQALCVWCNDIINYGGTGCNSLLMHTRTKKHQYRALAHGKSAGRDHGIAEKSAATKDRDYTILFPDKAKHLDFKKLDSSVKNKFRLKWLQKVAYVGERRYRFKDCLQKVTLPGQVLCIWCDDLVNYGSSGAKSLDSHMRTLKHMDSAIVVLGEAKAGSGDAGSSDEADQPVYSIQLATINDSADTTGRSRSAGKAGQRFTLTRTKGMPLQLLERSLKNRFRWEWLEKKVSFEMEYHLGDCLKKIDAPGQVMCIWCSHPISYSGSGLKALDDHVKSMKHVRNARLVMEAHAMIASALNQMTDEEKSGSRVVGETVRQATTSTSTAMPPTARGAGPGAQADTGNSTTPCNLWLEKDKEQQQLMDQNGQTGVRDTRLTVNAADKERDSTLRESQGASAVSDDPAVVEETTVKEYIKLIKCREYVTKKKNSKSGRVLSVSYRKEEDSPVISHVKSTTYESIGGTPQTVIKAKRLAISALSYRPVKRKRITVLDASSHERRDKDSAGADSLHHLTDSDGFSQHTVRSFGEMDTSHGANTHTDVSVNNSPGSDCTSGLVRAKRVNSVQCVRGTASLPHVAEQPCVFSSDAEDIAAAESGDGRVIDDGNVDERSGSGGDGERSGRGGDEAQGEVSIKMEPMEGSAAETMWTGAQEPEVKQEAGLDDEGHSDSDSDGDEDDEFSNSEELGSEYEDDGERLRTALENKKRIQDLRRQAESLKCGKCGTVFKKTSSCWRHLTRDNCDEWYECSACEKGFSTQLARNRHRKTHLSSTSQKPKDCRNQLMQCADCKCLFSSHKKYFLHKSKGRCHKVPLLHKESVDACSAIQV